MNDIDLTRRLQTAGKSPSAEFRAALESVLVDELEGRTFIATTSPTVTVTHERVWLRVAAVAAVVAAIAAVAVVVRDTSDRPAGPAPQPTTASPVTAPSTTSVTVPSTTDAAEVATTSSTAGTSAGATVSPDSDATSVARIWGTGLEVGVVRDEFGVDPLSIVAFQIDDTLLTVDTRNGRATSATFDRGQQWAIQIPTEVEGRSLVDAAIGPDGNLYGAYQTTTGEVTFAAVGTSGERAGQLLDSWDTNLGPCERCIGFYLRADGIGIEYVDDPVNGDSIRTTPYVDPVIGGTFEPPLLVNTGVAEPAPALPAGFADPTDPTYGSGQLQFFTVANTDEQTPTGESWTVDALGTSIARTSGTYHTPDGIFWGPFRALPDGSVMTTILTSTDGDAVPTVVVGRPGGAIELYRPLDNSPLIAYTEHDGVIYVVVSIGDSGSYAFLQLSPTAPAGVALDPDQRASLIQAWWNSRRADERTETCGVIPSQGIDMVAMEIGEPIQEDIAPPLPQATLYDDLAAFLTAACAPP